MEVVGQESVANVRFGIFKADSAQFTLAVRGLCSREFEGLSTGHPLVLNDTVTSILAQSSNEENIIVIIWLYQE